MIRIKSNTRAEIGRLFASLEFGEQIAHNCARQQALMQVEKRASLFLVRQATQEAYHAKIFGRVVSCITPRHTPEVPCALQQFRIKLEKAMQHNDLLETLVGQQIVLEGFGELVLHRLNKKFDQRRVGFKRLRRTVLHQEQGHQAFGERMVRALVRSGSESSERVQSLAGEYLFLVDQILAELQPLFDVVGADADLYKFELRKLVPHWILTGDS